MISLNDQHGHRKHECESTISTEPDMVFGNGEINSGLGRALPGCGNDANIRTLTEAERKHQVRSILDSDKDRLQKLACLRALSLDRRLRAAMYRVFSRKGLGSLRSGYKQLLLRR